MPEPIQLPDGTSASIDDLIRYAWTTGHFLEERLDPLQLELDQMFEAMPPRTRAFILEARKIGKTYGFLAYMDKKSRQNPGYITRIAFPTQKQGKTVILPILEELQAECPSDLKWVNREQQEACWVLPHTGARLYLAGTDTQDAIDRLRGPRANLLLLDEVTTFNDNLQLLIDSVLWPQTLNTGGLLLMSGTAPVSLEHPSIDQIDRARASGRLIIKTIMDNPRLSAEVVREICVESNPTASSAEIDEILAGKREGTPVWEREFMCKLIADKSARVTSEFDSNVHVALTHQNPFDLKFVFLDPGHVRDHFGATFCSLEFATQILHVHAEYDVLRRNTDTIKQQLLAIEHSLGWKDQRVDRYIDATSAQQASDFNSKGYRVSLAARSPGKGQLVVELRNILNAGRLRVSPKCKSLINQLSNGIWSSTQKDDFKRTVSMGHLDVLDSLAQGCIVLKNMGKWFENTVPKGVYYDPGRETVKYNELQLTERTKSATMLAKVLFGGRRR